MKTVLALLTAVAIGLAAYFLFFRHSPKEQLEALLIQTITRLNTPTDTQVSLDGCDLHIVVSVPGDDDAQLRLTRVAVRADLRNYMFKDVTLTPGTKDVKLRINRDRVTSRMLEQASSFVDAAKEKGRNTPFNKENLRDILGAEGGSVYFRVMAEIKDEDGTPKLIAHKDAPDFFAFAQAIEALEPPVSYNITTSYSARTPSAETLLTGHALAVAHLEFDLASQRQAKELAKAFYHYAKSERCY